MGIVTRSDRVEVVPFGFHRSRAALPDALDFGYAQTQSSDRKTTCFNAVGTYQYQQWN